MTHEVKGNNSTSALQGGFGWAQVVMEKEMTNLGKSKCVVFNP